jgi:hypothetical protein
LYMKQEISKERQTLPINIKAVAGLIVKTQKKSGEIPWFPDDKADPWDHVEAAMGLGVGGYLEEARLAFRWMAESQLSDGSWYASYRDSRPDDRTRDSNISSYVAVGVFHHYLLTGDKSFLETMWPVVEAAITFTLEFQAPGGEFYWAKSPEGTIDPMALLTGSSSIFMSLKCAIAIAQCLDFKRPSWHKALLTLGHALLHKRHVFNISKSRFSMDWFYPILCGALPGAEARKRVDAYWKKFVVEGEGVLCVSDEPWVTIAETSELCLTLSAMGNRTLSERVFSWICDRRFKDGSYWCGFTVPEITLWPEDKITWTNAVVLMAVDALYDLTPAGQIFNHRAWNISDGSDDVHCRSICRLNAGPPN